MNFGRVQEGVEILPKRRLQGLPLSQRTRQPRNGGARRGDAGVPVQKSTGGAGPGRASRLAVPFSQGIGREDHDGTEPARENREQVSEDGPSVEERLRALEGELK